MFEFVRLSPDDAEAMSAFVSGEEWPFHVGGGTPVYHDDEDTRPFWVITGGERIGLVRLQDLGDDTPMFDLRVRKAWRGRGVGKRAVAWLTGYLFTELPEINRIEGTTRVDNHAMRAVFRSCGYAKESHYRQAWPGRDGVLYDSIGYAILRGDWVTGTVTAPDWADEP